ncbi:MAG: peptidoglycan-binding protein, partial [Clostridia bacterium]|nr:peptidoglycan-binding protein [Clostridia bacterium]
MVLKRGSRGNEVVQVQTLLGIDADGIFGRKTEAAVKAFQAANGLKVDGIVGKNTWAALLGETQPEPNFKKPVDYKQYDSKWAKVMYSNHSDTKQTIKSSGCGPTAMADIVATMVDSHVTPVTLAELSLKWGCRTYSDGTAWSFFPKIADYYGFSKYVKSSTLATL